MRRLLAVLALGALVVACSERPTAPQPRTPAVAADFMNNPDNGNPRIYRTTEGTGACWTDPATGLRACHWSYALPDYGCGDLPGSVTNVQYIVPSDTARRIIANLKGSAWIKVRDTNAPGDCFGNQLVATGWGDLKYNDNNVVGVGRQNAWSYVASGNLVTPTGQPVKYSGHLACQFNMNNGKCQAQVNVH